MRKVIEATGALEATLELVDELAAEAKEAMATPLVPEAAHDLLIPMADVVVLRTL